MLKIGITQQYLESVSTNAIISNILWDGNKFIANIRENTNIKYGYSYR